MAILTGVFLLDFLGVITALIAVGYAYFKWKLTYWQRRNVPYIGTKDLQTKEFDQRAQVREAYDLAKSKGWRHYGNYMILKPTYVPVDLELIKNVVTKDFSYFVDRGLYFNERDDPINANLFNFGGKRWRNMRAKLSPTFTSGKLKSMFHTLVDCGVVLEEYIEDNITSTDAVDIKEILGRFSTDVIGSCAFGLECNTFKEPDSPFRKYSKKFLTPSSYIRFCHIFGVICPSLAKALRLGTSHKDVSEFYTKVVEDTVNYRLNNNVTRKDFLQLLIDMKSERDDKSENTDDDTTLTMKEIVAQCFLFFIAGFETSSTTMTFALLEMARHPEVQDKVREELNAALAQHGGQISYDVLNELKYMKQVIDETLRLYSAVPFLMRECVADYKVPGEDVIVEKGTRVIVPIVGLHYDSEYFKNPTKFDPDRFSSENRQKIPPYAYMAFGDGPRICIGERFGVMQTKVGLAFLLRKFKVTLDKKTQLPIKLSRRNFLPVVEGGVWLNLEKLTLSS